MMHYSCDCCKKALDPHKSLFLPYGTGALVVRDASELRRAHGMRASYLPPAPDDVDCTDFADLGPELSRDFRGLRVWLPIKMHGIAPFCDALDEKLDLTHWITEELRKIEGIEIVAEPQLSIVAFRLLRPNTIPNELNHKLIDRINARKRVMMTGTTIGTDFIIRICIVSHRTHMDRMQMCLEDIRAAVAELS